MLHRYHLIVILSLLALSAPVFADLPPKDSWTFTVRFENDLFADTDQYYTNGLKLSWISPEFDWFQGQDWIRETPLLSRLSDVVINNLPYSDDDERQRHMALSVGQKMFTPRDIDQRTLITDDRPYAGWLYGSVAYHSKTQTQLDTFEIQAGFTGDFSLAEQAQDLIHSIRDIDKANGWDNQIDTEVGIALIYDRKYRKQPASLPLANLSWDAIVHGGLAVGNVFTHFNSGVEMRLGWNLPRDFGSALIRPASDTSAPADGNDPRFKSGPEGMSFHVFAAITGRAVLRDVFLDGNTFSDSHSVDKKLLVGDFVIGASLTWGQFSLSYAQVLRTAEFEAQNGSQKFGSINFSYTY